MLAQRPPAERPRSADAVPPDFQSEAADSTCPSQVLQKLRKMVGEGHFPPGSALADESRRDLTGIAGSHCAIGEGMNAKNVRECVEMLMDRGYRGVLTMECEAEGGLMDASIAWMRQLIADVAPGVQL
jgi:hypothetical protein